MHICSFVHEDTLPEDLRNALEEELFLTFYSDGPAADVPDSNADALEHSGQNRSQALRFAVRKVAARARFTDLTKGNHALTERISHDAVASCANMWAQAQESARDDSERNMIRLLDRRGEMDSALAVAGSVPRLRRAAAVVKERREAVDRISANAGEDRLRLAAMEYQASVDALRESWTRIVDERELRQETSFLHRSLLPYIAELNRQVPSLARYVQTMTDLFGESARLWDFSTGHWQDVDTGAIEAFSDILRTEPSIRRLARILGRGRAASAEAEEVEERVVLRNTPYSGSAGRSEITGIRFGNDIGSLLPSEYALLSSPATEPLFYKRFAESELLCLAYTTELTYYRSEYTTETIRRMKAEERGPLILCVDTSGSMVGMPERVAKSLSLAVLKTTNAENRPAYLISFSDRIRTLDLAAPETSAIELSAFLRKSFHGGTDLRPALNESLRVLESARYKRADVLVISDFRIPKIMDRHMERVKRQQRENGTRFYSLTVNRAAVYDPFNIFDRSWLYDISDPDHPGIPTGSLTEL